MEKKMKYSPRSAKKSKMDREAMKASLMDILGAMRAEKGLKLGQQGPYTLAPSKPVMAAPDPDELEMMEDEAEEEVAPVKKKKSFGR